MAYSFNGLLDRWKHRLLSVYGETELRDHVLRGTVHYKDVVMTSTQLDSANATPIELIAAPGSGLALIPLAALTKVVAGSTAFELGSGTGAFKYTDGSGVEALTAVTNAILETTANATGYYRSVGLAGVPVVNAALVFQPGADVTAGNGNIYVRVCYLVVKVGELA